MKAKKMITLLLTICMTAGTILPVSASTTQQQLSDAQAQQAETQSQLSEVQSRIDELDSKKGETEEYLSELNDQLQDLTDRLTELQEQYSQKQQELETVQSELAEAQIEEESQYEAMKLRIQYMYETTSNTNLMAMLFSSGNIAELINRVEYIKTISDYDKNLTEEYHNTVLSVQDKEQQVEEEKAAIEVLQQENSEQQEAVQEVYAASYADLQDCIAELGDAEDNENSLVVQIAAQEEQINELLKKAKEEELEAQRKAAEEAAAKAAAEAAAQAAAQAAAEQAASDSGQTAYSEDEETPSTEQTGSDTEDTDTYEETAVYEETASAASEETVSEETSQTSEETSSAAESSGSNRVYLGNFVTTAYCACSICCGQWAGGGTASGTTPTAGRTVAMGGVPFGTKLEINGVVYTVEDRGTAYGHVDIFFDSHSDALNYGMRYADVYEITD